MRLRALAVGCLALLATTAVIAQAASQPNDPVTGKWGANGLTFLELKLEGGTSVNGTTIWRNDDWESRAAIKTGSFDPKTGALKLEGEAKDPEGNTVTYLIEGTIANDTVSGTFKVGDMSGQFQFKRLEA